MIKHGFSLYLIYDFTFFLNMENLFFCGGLGIIAFWITGLGGGSGIFLDCFWRFCGSGLGVLKGCWSWFGSEFSLISSNFCVIPRSSLDHGASGVFSCIELWSWNSIGYICTSLCTLIYESWCMSKKFKLYIWVRTNYIGVFFKCSSLIRFMRRIIRILVWSSIMFCPNWISRPFLTTGISWVFDLFYIFLKDFIIYFRVVIDFWPEVEYCGEIAVPIYVPMPKLGNVRQICMFLKYIYMELMKKQMAIKKKKYMK